MKLKYFAWVRERIGVAEEDVDLPTDVTTTEELLVWLRGRGEGYALALAPDAAVRIALDKVHVPGDAPLGDAREVALFPPMTGG